MKKGIGLPLERRLLMPFFSEDLLQAANLFFPLGQEAIPLALAFVQGTEVIEQAKGHHCHGESQTDCRIDCPHGQPLQGLSLKKPTFPRSTRTTWPGYFFSFSSSSRS